MGRLVYFASTSLDGYVDDADGGFGWAEPTPEVHRFVNDLQRTTGTHLYGRRTYEVMRWWEEMPEADTATATPEMQEAMDDFGALWRQIDKVVYSSTLDEVTTARTRLERRFDPDEVAGLKAELDHDLSIGGPTLAGRAIAADLVDEYQMIVNPVVVGGGTRALPDGMRIDLRLTEQHAFADGAVFLRYLRR